MSRRIEIELTSTREDGTWTWRKAGGREPKGVVEATLVPDGSSVGDVLKADADFMIDGIDIVGFSASTKARTEAETLEVIGGEWVPGVVETRAPRSKGRGKGGDRKGGDRKGRGRGRDGDKREGRDADNRGENRADKERSPRKPRNDDRPAKPKPKRLRAKKVHRSAVLEALAPEQRPVAEQVLRGGLPAVRKALEEQNVTAKTAGQPEIDPAPLMKLAEDMLPSLKAAEWRDRAEAAIAGMNEISLADIRSVVVAADGNTRSDEAKAVADKVRAGLLIRVELEQSEWLSELTKTVEDGRTVRALRLSSRPPKAGTPLPAELLTKLAGQASEGLTPDVNQQRWATVLDAVSYSPARGQVVPVGLPAEPGEELLAAVKKLASRVPAIAELFGIKPAARRSKQRPKPPPSSKPKTEAPAAETPADSSATEPAADAPAAPVEAEAIPAPDAEVATDRELATEVIVAAEDLAPEDFTPEQSEATTPAEEPVTETEAPSDETDNTPAEG